MPNQIQNHRLDQLLARIENKEMARNTYRNKQTGSCCIIGHMMDMAGILDEIRLAPNWGDDEGVETFATSGQYIDSIGMIRAATTLTEHFGLGVQQLRELQEVNDCEDSTVDDIKEYLWAPKE